MARKLRIAVSVFFGLLTATLCMWLWGAIRVNEGLSLLGLGDDPLSLNLYLNAALVSSVMAGIPWIAHLPTRFSLRALLIATTLVAVVLGLAVWSAR